MAYKPSKFSEKNLDEAKKIILREIELTKELKDIREKKNFYQWEITELGKQMHVTRDGVTIFISDMTDEHIINMVKLHIQHHGSIENAPRKYLDEVKDRWLIDTLLSSQRVLSSGNSLDEDSIIDSAF